MKKHCSIIIFLLVISLCLSPSSVLAKSLTVTISLAGKGTRKTITVSKGDSIKIRSKRRKKILSPSSLKYKSLKKTVATVNKKGVIKTRKTGTVTITIRGKSGKASLKVKVKAPSRPLIVKPYDTGKGVALLVTNTKSDYLNISGDVVFRDASGRIIYSLKAHSYGVNPGAKTVLWVKCLSDYSSYEYSVSINKTTFKPLGLNKIKVTTEKSIGGLNAIFQNSSKSYAFGIHVHCLFFDSHGKLISCEDRYALCQKAGSVDHQTFNYPYDKNGKRISPASYKVFVSSASKY